LEKLRESVDALIVIPNDKLLDVVDRRVSLQESFVVVDEVLLRGVQGISDIITIPDLSTLTLLMLRALCKLPVQLLWVSDVVKAKVEPLMLQNSD